MDTAVNGSDEEERRAARRRQRIQEMKRRKKRQERMRRLFIPCSAALIALIILTGWGMGRFVQAKSAHGKTDVPVQAGGNVAGTAADLFPVQDEHRDKKDVVSYDKGINVAGCYIGSGAAGEIAQGMELVEAIREQPLGGGGSVLPLQAVADSATMPFGSDVVSQNGIFIDVGDGRIIAQKDPDMRINPASMTKILTVLVAAEHVTDLDAPFEITIDITDYSFANECSNAGFEAGEVVTVRDLFYGTILPSGADAALGLATYVAGSQEAFVALMNQKIEELGLSGTSHFTNCVGLYDEDHYSTAYDMSVMLKAAYDNSFCREVLAEHVYPTSFTEQHPEGIILSNWFLRRIEDKDTHGEVLCAKTGYVDESGSCAASLIVGRDGREYICVTAGSTSSWRCIYDHVALCQQFIPG